MPKKVGQFTDLGNRFGSAARGQPRAAVPTLSDSAWLQRQCRARFIRKGLSGKGTTKL